MSTQPAVDLRVIDHLTRDEVDAVLSLLRAATDADGFAPLDEVGLLGLRTPQPGRRHVLAERDRAVVGYAHRTPVDPEPGANPDANGEAVVHPAHRRSGIGERLLRTLLETDPARPLRIWAHGDHPGARALADKLGFATIRELWRMRASLDRPLPRSEVNDVTIRPFRPGLDDEAWLQLNAAAFAAHPEQGSWTLADLRRRMDEPWFDPDGFFLAERAGELVGFHWTKVHDGADKTGEIYILGVHPAAHASGLGTALAVAGLRHLHEQGLAEVILFVEGDNAGAIRLYRRLGFVHTSSDLMYRHPGYPG